MPIERIGFKGIIPGVSTLGDVEKEFGGPNLQEITSDGPRIFEWFGSGRTIANQAVISLKFGFVEDRLACLSVSFPRRAIETVNEVLKAKYPDFPADNGPTRITFERNDDRSTVTFVDRELLIEFQRQKQAARDERFRRMVEDI